MADLSEQFNDVHQSFDYPNAYPHEGTYFLVIGHRNWACHPDKAKAVRMAREGGPCPKTLPYRNHAKAPWWGVYQVQGGVQVALMPGASGYAVATLPGQPKPVFLGLLDGHGRPTLAEAA